MTIRTIIRASLVVATIAATGDAQPVSTTAAPTQRKSAPAESAKPAIDPQAITALDKMGDFLRSQQSFTVHTTRETEYVLPSGQKIRLSARGDIRVRRPDRLRADVMAENKQRQFFYDGQTFTMFGPQLGLYASVPAPSTIEDLADELQDRYGLELPMVDLFRWGTDESGKDAISSAVYIGESNIDGVTTDHYAFRQPGLDWEIWIEKGERPLPRKLVLTTTDDPARPAISIAMRWDLDTKHADSDFVFVPPKDSTKIGFAEIARRAPQSARR